MTSLLDEYLEFYEDHKYLPNLNIIQDITNVANAKENNPNSKNKKKKIEFDHIENYKKYDEEEDNHIDSSALKIQKNNNKNDIITINIIIPNIERTRETTYIKKKINTEYLRKKKKVPYGSFIKYYNDNKIKNYQEKQSNIKNKFLKKYPQICKDILTYFMDDAPKFLDHRAIELITAIVDYGQIIINENIKDDSLLLYYISYDNFCEHLEKSFTNANYNLSLKEIFIKFQDNKEEKFINNNKKVIEYIRENELKEKEAHELLELSFYELCDNFTENHLNEYLGQRRAELILAYGDNFPFGKKTIIIDAFINIIETLSKEFKDYSNLKKGRYIKPKKFFIRRPEKNKKSKK